MTAAPAVRTEDYMAYFERAQDVYETIGTLFSSLVSGEDELSEAFLGADTVVRYRYTDPEAVITVSLCAGDGRVEFGESDLEAEVVMSMSADTAHRFWLGEVNVTTALARGDIRAEGPVAKLLKLVPLAKPAFPRYRQQLIDQGRPELATV